MGSTRRHTAAQRELYGGLSDLLGGTDDWDMEEEENDRGEGGGKVREKLEDATKLKSTPSTQDEKAKSPVARYVLMHSNASISASYDDTFSLQGDSRQRICNTISG